MTGYLRGALLVLTVLCITYTEASIKKGLCLGHGKYYHCNDEYVFTNVHWWYDWQQNPNKEHLRMNCSMSRPLKSGYVPMVWGIRNRDKPINYYQNSKYILGFNEPDHPSQSNLTGADAAREWRKLESKSVGKIMVSPAFSALNNHWFPSFLKACQGCRIDHIATHMYSCDATHVMNTLRNMWNRYHKPIWLTEFSCPHTTSADEQLRFMKEILPKLEAAHFIFRYSWFVTRQRRVGRWVEPSTSLLKPFSSQFTPLGAYYNSFMH